jgi:hypothetical protein
VQELLFPPEKVLYFILINCLMQRWLLFSPQCGVLSKDCHCRDCRHFQKCRSGALGFTRVVLKLPLQLVVKTTEIS